MLRPGLRVVFLRDGCRKCVRQSTRLPCGPGNSRRAGAAPDRELTPVQLEPAEFERLPEFGIGLTDICKVLYGSDDDVGTVEFDVAALRRRSPRPNRACLAFNGKNAARGALERAVDFGPQEEQIGGASGLGSALHLRRVPDGTSGTSGPGAGAVSARIGPPGCASTGRGCAPRGPGRKAAGREKPVPLNGPTHIEIRISPPCGDSPEARPRPPLHPLHRRDRGNLFDCAD